MPDPDARAVDERVALWCVMRGDIWCSTKNEPTWRFYHRDTIATLCGRFVMFTGEIEKRQPTCGECLALLSLETALAALRATSGEGET